MYRARRNRKIIIGSLLILLLMISVGYAAFQTSLTIRGTSRITSNWDVRITNVTTGVATGDAENVSTPTWTDLTAYMEANLYDKGSAMDYDVTISNRGTFDAKLDNIITTPSSNEAVIITFSGYTKGETLAKGQDKVIHVKIQYNPNYNGTAEVSGTSIVEFQYVQDEGSNIPTETRYLLTYDYGENGGTSTNAENEYLAEGTVVNLSGKVATKAGYTFVGWNTDKNAHTALSTTTMTANTTLYAIYSKNITITFDKNGNTSQTNASGTAVTTQTVTRTCTMWNKDESCSVTAPIMVAASGFSIDGYSTGPTVYSNYWTHNTAKNVSADATWYAQSTKAGVDRTITFYRNGNTNFIHGGTTTTGTSRAITVCTTPAVHNGATQAGSCSANFTMPTITAPNATPTVLGWSEGASNRTIVYTSGQVVNNLEMTSNRSLYAQTQKAPLDRTITFYKNGNTSFTYGGTTYTDNSKTFTVCTIAASYNGSSQGGSCTANVTMPTITAPSATPDVIGWSTGANTRTATYTSGQTVNSLAMTADKSYYAQSQKTSVDRTITFYRNGNTSFTHGGTTTTGTSRAITVCTIGAVYNGASQSGSCSASFTMPTITAPSATPDVIGWSDAADNRTASYTSGQVVNSLSMSSNRSLYAQSQKAAIPLTASWNANGATLSSTATSSCNIAAAYNGASQGDSCTVDAPTITRSNYDIIGFNTSASSTANNSSYNTSTKKLTLTSSNTGSTWYAVTKNTYAFEASWEANGATLSSTTTKTCYIYNTDVSCTVDAPTITRNGYTIIGFNQSPSETTNNSSYNTTTGKLTLTSSNTGTWYAITRKTEAFTANWNANGASLSSTAAKTCYIYNTDVSCTVDAPTITREGFTITGFNTTADATTNNSSYSTSTKKLTLTSSNTGNTWYAITYKTFTITYAKGTGVSSISPTTTSVSKTIRNNASSIDVTLPKINPSTNYEALGWFDGDTKVGDSEGTYAATGAITLTAKAKVLPVLKSSTSSSSNVLVGSSGIAEADVTSIVFEDNKNIPNGATNWDVSAVSNSGAVMAWVTADPNDNTKYVLHVGGDGGVIANTGASYLFDGFTNVTSINFGNNFDTTRTTNMQYMFRGNTTLTNLNLSNFDTSKVTNMQYMFSGCTGLTGITFGTGWGHSTASSNTMNQMFYNCTSLTSLDLSNFDTSNVTSMTYMFRNCTGLTGITFGSGWSSSTATSNTMSQMFYNCSSLTNLNLSSLDTSNVTSMASMFDSCSSLTNLNLSTFDTSKVTSMSYMFDSCSSLTSITFGEGWSHSTATSNSMTFMFYKCSNLTSLNLTSFDTSNVTNMTAMFSNCSGLIDLDVSSFDTSNVTLMGGSSDNYGMFYNCKNLTSLNLNSFDTSSVTNMYSMFQACSNLTNLNLCIFDTSLVTKMNRMFYGTTKMQAIFVGTGWDQSGATTTGMFTASGVSSVTQLTDCVVQTSSPVIKAFDTTTNTLMGSSGIAKTSVTSIVFENNTNAPSGATPWEVSAVANTKNVMAWVTSNGSGGYILHVGGRGKVIANDDSSKIFSDFTNVTSITFNGNYDTSNVTNMTQMFTSCTSLTSLDLSDFDTTNVTSMNSMFRNCTSLTSLDLSEFDTSSVTDMYGMFAGSDMSGTQTKMMLASITGLDGFDTSEVTDMRYLFFNCGELTTIDLSSFDTSSVTKMNDMFNNVNDLTSKLTTIVFGDDFDTSSVENISCMFADNPLLTSIDLSGFDTSNVEDMSYLFNRCYGLRQLLLCSFDTSSVTNMNYMFANMTNIQSIYVGSSWDESNATTTNMFQNSNITAVTKLSYCQNLEGKSLIKKWTSDATSDFHAAAYKSSITSIEFLDEIDVPAGATSWDVSEAGDESVMAWVTADPNDNTKYALHIASDGGVIGNPDSSCIFYNFTNLISIDFNGNYDTSLANTMKRMFSNSTKITSLDVSSLDTGNVTDMYAMFSGSDASGNQTKMGLTQIIGLTEWDTSKVTDMAYMFFNCGNLTEIDLSGFNTSNVTNMASMFNAPNDFSSKLTNIIFSEDFDTSNVTNMGLMFADNPLLETLNLTSFNTSNVTNMNQMFSNNRYKLRTIYTSNSFVTTSVSDSTNMFNNDYVLVGGNGTKYNTSYLDKTYAKIDKLGQVGYFTDGSLPSIRDVTTTSTATTLTVAVDALVPDGNDEIVTYEYSIDNGSTWVFADTNTHTFTGLTKDTFYPLKVRVTTQGGKQATWQIADIDNEIPTYQALFWGDAQNSANTTTTLKNKVSGTNGTLSNFNNTTTSGYNGTGAARNIMFDGSNDFVNLGLTNYNFNKTVSLILYGRIYEYPTSNANVFSNAYGSGKAGMAINTNTHKKWAFTVHNGTAWQDIQGTTVYDTSKFYTVIATFNGANEKIYVDGILEGTTANTVLNTSAMPLVIGGYPTSSTTISAPIKLSLKEAMVYNRALEDGEIANISSTLQKKYSVKTEDLEKVTYSQTTSGSTATVTMTFPSECGSTYTCSYVKDGGSPVTVTSTSATESFTGAGTLEGTIVTPEGTSTTTYNAAVKYNITYAKGSNVSSIGATSGSCNLAAGATSCTVTLPSITANTGYSSVGWNTTSGATTGTAAGGTLTLTATGWTRYANAKANTHSISYNLNSGTHGSSHPTSATYNVASTINNPTRSGYTFNGWTISGMDSTTHYFGSTTSTATSSSGRKETSFKNLRATSGTVTFTAAWTQNKVTITSSKSTNNTDGYQSCTGSWNNSKYQYNINYNGSSVSSGKLCYAESSGGSTTGCKNYSSSGTTGYGSACFNSATSWTYYRSSGCTYAYAKAANGASASKYQC